MKASISLTCAGLFFAGIVPTAAEDTEKTTRVQAGQVHYNTCLACHGADGKGMQVGPMKMAPSLEGSKLLMGDPEIPVSIVLRGIQKKDAKYAGMMAALGAALDDEKLAAVLTYTRNSFGNSGDVVTAEQVAEIREKYKDKLGQPWKRAELDALVASTEGGAVEEASAEEGTDKDKDAEGQGKEKEGTQAVEDTAESSPSE